MDYTIVGKIIGSHGVKGDVKVYPITNDIKRFSSLKKAYFGDDKIEVSLESVKYHKDMVILKFREFHNINEVLIFKDEYLYINTEDRIKLPNDSYFIHDLIDCNVYDTSGKIIGILKDVIQGDSNDLYIVKNDKIKKEYLIPAVKNFIKEIDIRNKKIIIKPIEGLIEWR